MKSLLVAPLLIPFGFAALSLLFWKSIRFQRAGAIGSMGLLVINAAWLLMRVSEQGIQTVQLGGWPAPFGITLVADLFSGLMLLLAAIIGLAVAIYSTAGIDRDRERFGYYPLFGILIMGVSGAFLTGDLFDLYVWFEVMLMASFVLLALGGEREQMAGAMKYVTLNLLSSGMFLAAVGITYGMTGTLNMADLAQKIPVSQGPAWGAVGLLLFVAFGIKAAVFPLFFWLPASYPTPPVPVSAVFAGLLTKVGVYAMFRVFTLLFHQEAEYTRPLFVGVAGFTMVTGVLGAVAQHEFRRILAFHSISQIGYILLGLAWQTPLALAGGIFFILHHSIVKTSLFLVSGVVWRSAGSFELGQLGGFYRSAPLLSGLFLILAFSLAGMPPSSGFAAKLILVQAGLATGSYALVAVALGVGFLTLFSMTKIWAGVFWKPSVSPPMASQRPGGLIAPIAVLAGLTLFMGIGAQFFLGLSERAAHQLLDRHEYIEAVMGASG